MEVSCRSVRDSSSSPGCCLRVRWYRIEPVSGPGDDAYYLIDKSTVNVVALVGTRGVTIALTKISGLPGEMPPEPEAKAIALSLAKAAIAKLR
jgi:hypothetical protein